jgi:DNA replication and repair protein RecF
MNSNIFSTSILKKLHLEKFRNHHDFTLDIPQRLLITGKNGVGKTNILEALSILSLTKSFRTHANKIFFTEGSYYTRISGTLEDKTQLSCYFEKHENMVTKRIFEKNEISIPPVDFIRHIPIVIYTPDVEQIVTGSPQIRRHFLDVLLCQTDALYALSLQKYKYCIHQKNALLRLEKYNDLDMNIWDNQILELGWEIISKRQDIIENLQKEIQKIYQQYQYDNEVPYMTYAPYHKDQSSWQQSYKNSQRKNIYSQTTTYGPHRDDILFTCNDTLYKHYASRGQIRTLVLSLKLAEVYLIQKTYSSLLFLIDDICIDLDTERQKIFFQSLPKNIQIIITATEQTLLPHKHDFEIYDLKESL